MSATITGTIAIALLSGSLCTPGGGTPTPPARDYVACDYTCTATWSHRVTVEGQSACINEVIENQTLTFPNYACFTAGVDQTQAFQRTITYFDSHEAELKLNWLHGAGDPQTTTGATCSEPRETWVAWSCQPASASQCSMQRNGAGSYTQCAAP